eukprot:56365-Amphidinium_carterae.1
MLGAWIAHPANSTTTSNKAMEVGRNQAVGGDEFGRRHGLKSFLCAQPCSLKLCSEPFGML